MAMKTVMVRIIVDVDETVSDETIIKTIRTGTTRIPQTRMWIAVDHPRPQDASKIWEHIASGVDPQGAGSANKV